MLHALSLFLFRFFLFSLFYLLLLAYFTFSVLFSLHSLLHMLFTLPPPFFTASSLPSNGDGDCGHGDDEGARIE